MCEFISWIEKDGKVLFLTGDDVFNTSRGKLLQKHCRNKDDLTGHGAIRWFFGTDDKPITGGKEREYTNFLTPDNFPKQIVKAIKKGQMWGFGEIPQGILSAPLYADYQAKGNALYVDYQAKGNALDADYQAKRAPLYADYQAKGNALYADYQAKGAPLDADYQAKRAPLYADYQAKGNALDADFWVLVRQAKNRSPKWK